MTGTYSEQMYNGFPLGGVILWYVTQLPLDSLSVLGRGIPPSDGLHELAAVLHGELIQEKASSEFRHVGSHGCDLRRAHAQWVPS